MATVIKAGNVASGAQVTPDATGILQFNTGSGAGTAAMTIDASQNVTFAQTVTFAQAANLPNTFGFKNRIINGAMVIDQRNAGASRTPASADYLVDRWQYAGTQASRFTAQQNQGSVTPPAGFTNYFGLTTAIATSLGASDYFLFRQMVEGFNFADLGWGAAGAQSVTLSFWVRSSLTGTFGGALNNSALNRSYPFTYTISAANTWEQKSITIAGDTSGTWVTNNGIGVHVHFSLGTGTTNSGTAGSWASALYLSATGATSVVGTNGATWYITGVQLEKGSTATSFDYRPYGTELQLCQRYYYRTTASFSNSDFAMGYAQSTTIGSILTPFPVTMRTSPTALEQSGTASDYQILYGTTAATCTSVPLFAIANQNCARSGFTVAAVLTAGNGLMARASGVTTAYLGWSAEL